MALEITIPIEPRSKKNSPRIIKARGHYMVLPSKQFVEYQKACGTYLEGLLADPIDYPCEVSCIFYMATRRRCDLNNMLESITDVLVHYNILKDDNRDIVASHDKSRVFYDKENPRTEIKISEYQGEYAKWGKE